MVGDDEEESEEGVEFQLRRGKENERVGWEMGDLNGICGPLHASPTCQMEFDERALGMVLGLEWVVLGSIGLSPNMKFNVRKMLDEMHMKTHSY